MVLVWAAQMLAGFCQPAIKHGLSSAAKTTAGDAADKNNAAQATPVTTYFVVMVGSYSS
jgi:hypothetical protein